MKQSFQSGRGPPKLNPAAYRYVVRFDAVENGVFLSLFEKSGAVNKAAFIRMCCLESHSRYSCSMKIPVISSIGFPGLNADYRTICINYDLLVKTLRENFTEKKAMKILYQLEQYTIDLVKLNREIVALAKEFDGRWSQKST